MRTYSMLKINVCTNWKEVNICQKNVKKKCKDLDNNNIKMLFDVLRTNLSSFVCTSSKAARK